MRYCRGSMAAKVKMTSSQNEVGRVKSSSGAWEREKNRVGVQTGNLTMPLFLSLVDDGVLVILGPPVPDKCTSLTLLVDVRIERCCT